MSEKLDKKILKKIPNKIIPLKIFDKNIINFLDELSKKIFLISDKLKKYPDLISFAFWCRKKNILKFSNFYKSSGYRLGRGRVLHITPSNVPVNFAFSLAFGLLSGNYNIVRLPTTNFEQTKYITQIIYKCLKKKKFKKIRPLIKFIKYERNINISKKLSSEVEARIIWGGDSTVELFKSFKTKPRCTDLFFPDRNSCSIINLEKFNKLKDDIINSLLLKFYNDIYTMDQNACSSPKLIFFLTKKKENIYLFWKKFQTVVDRNYDFDLSIVNQKILNLSKNILKFSKKNNFFFDNFNLARIEIKKKFNLENLNDFNSGFFFEKKINHLSEISDFIDSKTQTITYYGVNKKNILNTIEEKGVLGIDRIVPIGQAFDITPTWDGYDTILHLSRVVKNN